MALKEDVTQLRHSKCEATVGKINIIDLLLLFWPKLETVNHSMHGFLQDVGFGLLASSFSITYQHRLQLNEESLLAHRRQSVADL